MGVGQFDPEKMAQLSGLKPPASLGERNGVCPAQHPAAIIGTCDTHAANARAAIETTVRPGFFRPKADNDTQMVQVGEKYQPLREAVSAALETGTIDVITIDCTDCGTSGQIGALIAAQKIVVARGKKMILQHCSSRFIAYLEKTKMINFFTIDLQHLSTDQPPTPSDRP